MATKMSLCPKCKEPVKPGKPCTCKECKTPAAKGAKPKGFMPFTKK